MLAWLCECGAVSGVTGITKWRGWDKDMWIFIVKGYAQNLLFLLPTLSGWRSNGGEVSERSSVC